MSFDLQKVTISVFDIHATVDPLRGPSADFYCEALRFLADAALYTDFFRSRKTLDGGGLRIRALSTKDLDTHLWRSYRRIHDGDQWKLQVPLTCRPLEYPIKLNLPKAGFEATANVEMWLSAIGWSTHIQVTLAGELIKNADLRELIGRITDPSYGEDSSKVETADKAFVVGDKPKSLIDAFKFFQELLVKRAFLPGKLPHPSMKIPRHIVIGLEEFKSDGTFFDKMATGDKAVLLGILYGKALGVGDVAQALESVSHTRMSGLSFALTDFDHGTLIFPQGTANRRKTECLIGNITSLLMITWRLLRFYDLSEDAAAGTTASVLRGHVLRCLKRLPKEYTNQFCRNLFRTHNVLRDLSTKQ